MKIAEKLGAPGAIFQQLQNVEDHVDEDASTRIAAFDLIIERCEAHKRSIADASRTAALAISSDVDALVERQRTEADAASAED